MPARKPTGKIERLQLQPIVDPMLEADRSYPEIIDEVQKQRGVLLNDSNLSRYRGRWDSARARIEEAAANLRTLEQVLRANPETDFAAAGIGLLMSDTIMAMADAKDGFQDADKLELGRLFLQATRTQQEGQALALQKAKMQAIDRPALYLECLQAFTDYLTEHAPSALTTLGETFDGFMDQVRKAQTNAAQTAH